MRGALSVGALANAGSRDLPASDLVPQLVIQPSGGLSLLKSKLGRPVSRVQTRPVVPLPGRRDRDAPRVRYGLEG